ncbi:MAG: gliding motility-associated C-terminal domain-containing protein [Bacteroidota bacterium]
MNIIKHFLLTTLLVGGMLPKVQANTLVGDTVQCLIEFELEQMDNGDYLVAMIPDTTWNFPNNVVSTAQITIKATTGQLEVSNVDNLIDEVIFFVSATVEQPQEAPDFDYISFTLGSQGTADIPFQKGEKVNLFTFTNIADCNAGTITLMNNATDPFSPPNSSDANVGQQMTAAGFRLADLPIGVRGMGIQCGEDATPPIDTTNNNLDSADLGVQIIKQNISCFGFNNGIIVAKANGGLPPYNYAWGTRDTTSTIENLAAGVYGLTVTDANDSSHATLVVIEEPSQLILTIEKTDETDRMANGTATPSLTGGTPPYRFNWSNGSSDSLQTNLSADMYTLSVTDANGCEVTQTITIEDEDCPTINLMIDMKSPDCPGDSTGTLQVLPSDGTAPYTYLWETGDTTANLINLPTGTYMVTVMDANGCDMSMSILLPDANPIVIQLTADEGDSMGDGSISSIISGGMMPYTYTWSNGSNETSLSGLSTGVYDLTITDANGCRQTASAVIDPPDCSIGILDTFGSTLTLDTISCSEQGEICLPIPLDSMVNYSLFLDGTSFMEQITGCEFEATYSYTYFELFDKGNSGPYVLNSWSINEENFSGEFQNIGGLIDSINTWDVAGTWTLDTTVFIIEGGFAQNNYGSMSISHPATSATINIDANTNQTPTATLIRFAAGTYELVLVDKNTACSDSLTIIQPCGDEMDRDTADCPPFIDTDTFAIQVPGCDNFEICAPLFYDSLLNYAVTDNGEVYTGIVAPCDDDAGTTLNFSSPQTHQLIFTNRVGCQDTVTIAIHAPDCDEDLEIRDTIEIMEVGRTCIDFAGLPIPYQSVRDLCPEKNGEMAMLTIGGATGCIDYTGIELGIDTACIEICDVFGFCDTVNLIIIVTSGDLINPEIDAIDDTTTTAINEAVVFNALGNDIFGTLDDMYLVGAPSNGIATFNLDGTIRYTPITDYCNDTIPDTFQYAICAAGICDTATVLVFVSCTSDRDFVIYNALSPNGDGINDVFQIDGIEDFPNNSVEVFNRWGNSVYEMAGYKNEWNGTWSNDGKLLPDGTYFYLFNTGEGEVFSGWLEIKR